MKHEMRLTAVPVGPLTARNGNPEVSETGSPSWAREMHEPQATPLGLAKEKNSPSGQNGAGDDDQLLTVDEFADRLRISRACVRKWILERKVAVVKLGRLVRLRSSELRRLVNEGTRPRGRAH